MRSLKPHSFEASLHHKAKSSVIWDVQSHEASSQEGLPWTEFSLPHRKILRPVNIVFDVLTWMTLNRFLCRRFSTAYQTLKYKCRCVVCHAISRPVTLWIKGISKFTGSNAVFTARVHIYVFLLPKFSVKHWWMLNGNFKPLLDKCFDWIIPSDKQQTIAFFISAPASRLHIDPTSCPCSPASSPLPPPVLPGSRPPLSPSTNYCVVRWFDLLQKTLLIINQRTLYVFPSAIKST